MESPQKKDDKTIAGSFDSEPTNMVRKRTQPSRPGIPAKAPSAEFHSKSELIITESVTKTIEKDEFENIKQSKKNEIATVNSNKLCVLQESDVKHDFWEDGSPEQQEYEDPSPYIEIHSSDWVGWNELDDLTEYSLSTVGWTVQDDTPLSSIFLLELLP